jgi:type IV pilus assembly protein PilW
MHHARLLPRLTPRRSEAGRSLVELMVAMAIGLALIASIAVAYVSVSRTARYADGMTDVADAGQVALYVMGDAIRQAGFGEIVGSEIALGPGDPQAMRSQTLFGAGAHLRGCAGRGFVDETAIDPTCAAAAGDPNFDTLMVRFQGDSVIPPGQGAITDCLGAAVPDEPLPPDHVGLVRAAARPMVHNVYFGAAGQLRCRGNGRANVAAAWNAAGALVGNVEQFKVFYGFDDVRYAGGAPNASASVRSLRDADWINALPAGMNPWDFVISVHVCMVVRSAPAAGAVQDLTQTFTRCPANAAEAAGPPLAAAATDGALRRTYQHQFVVRARSPASPKEFLP